MKQFVSSNGFQLLDRNTNQTKQPSTFILVLINYVILLFLGEETSSFFLQHLQIAHHIEEEDNFRNLQHDMK